MKIVLLRHGKVNYPPITMLSAASFKAWVNSYNTNKLDTCSKPSNDAISIAMQAGVVVCSALPRSIESANLLGVKNITISDAMFNEAGLPTPNWNFPKLSVRIWAIVFRIAWFFGYATKSENLTDAKNRAANAASKLEQLAAENSSVLFVGHGIMNRFIAKELRQRNWLGPKSPSKNYWDFGNFIK